MSAALQTTLIIFSGVAAFSVLGRLALALSARRIIRRAFQGGSATVFRIRHFNGFLDLGSVSAALTTTAYVAAVSDQEGRESEVLCLVHYLPLLGLAHSVEVSPGEPNAT